MTVAELAKRLNTTVYEIFEHYKKIYVDIPQDENYILTTKQIRKAIPYYGINEKSEYLNNINELSHSDGLKDINEEKITNKIKTINDSKPFDSNFKKKKAILLNEIKEHNSISNLILEGNYRKVERKNFGFFENVTDQNGASLTYPVSNELIDEIFIPTDELINGKRYLFEVEIAKRNERHKKDNPFLLQAKNNNLKEIIQLNAISEELKVKQEKIEKLNIYLENIEKDFEERKKEGEERISKTLEKKQDEANKIIETYNETINQKFNEIQKKEKELSNLNERVEATNNHLQKMENLITTLKDRISLCRNLQFINEEEENKYLNILTSKKYNPENHLDFEKDFKNSFSELSDHVHAYLYHKKKLIYTQYQIKNFLTLLRTHDLIVLSGLSGSGKTQIVKAFAEALGGVAKIIPVKPNWMSSDDLTGYYNPLQMSFLPTPFTEAIIEASSNPHQLYFICLDEMNLARVEYYFADFLSRLEERNHQPEIELYAKHEEELFNSEFNTMLNLIESSIQGKKIKSWQEFLDDEDSRKKFFEMLGNTDKESMLQLHSKMKRRLIDILKFPSTIKIPDNVRFIGAINVDETTHYFSPKILDRIHIVKFHNPLIYEEKVNNHFKNIELNKELLPVYVQPNSFSARTEYPTLNNEDLLKVTKKLKEINQMFLLPLNIDFGIRSIRQSLNYAELNKASYSLGNVFDVSLNTIILQKILPRFIFDGSEISNNGESKTKIVENFQSFLSNEFEEFYSNYDSDESIIGKLSSEHLKEMIKQANINNSQFNFFA